MLSRLRGLFAGCGAIAVALGLAVGTAGAYESTDNKLPSPTYGGFGNNPNNLCFMTPQGPYRIDSFFDVFTDFNRIPPPPGPVLHSFFDVFTELHMGTPGGPATWTGNAQGSMLISPVGGLPPGEPIFDIEILQMDLIGGSGLPPGVAIRESPTKASTGKTSITDIGGGLYRIDSFFDVFTELTLDGGMTWTPNDYAVRIRGGVPEPSAVTLLGIAATALAACGRRRRA